MQNGGSARVLLILHVTQCDAGIGRRRSGQPHPPALRQPGTTAAGSAAAFPGPGRLTDPARRMIPGLMSAPPGTTRGLRACGRRPGHPGHPAGTLNSQAVNTRPGSPPPAPCTVTAISFTARDDKPHAACKPDGGASAVTPPGNPVGGRSGRFRARWGMHNYASSRAIGVGTAVLIVSPELCSRARWGVVNKPLARSAGASGYAPLVSSAYLRTRASEHAEATSRQARGSGVSRLPVQ